MHKPLTQGELQALLQSGATNGHPVMLDPATDMMINSTINVVASGKAGDGYPWGVKGNGAKIRWAGGDADMLVYTGFSGASARCLTIEGLSLFGNGYAGTPAKSCLKLSAPAGDNGPLYKFTLRDIYASYAQYGIVLEGGVYEGAGYNLHAENHRKDGILLQHLPNAIVSNIFLYGLNISRNLGAGLRSVYSTNVYGFSAILNGEGGIVAPEGIRFVSGGNGENTGESVVVLESNGYGSVVQGMEASSDGKTVARQYSNGQWVDVGKPCLYAVDMRSALGAVQQNCHCSYYGAMPNPMKVTKP